MNRSVRPALSLLAVAFTGYLAAGALLWTAPPRFPLLQITAVALYLPTTWLCIFWRPRNDHRPDHPIIGTLGERTVLPRTAAALALAAAALIPSVSWLAAGPAARNEHYAMWSLGAIGALMVVVVVRRRPWIAWSGIVLLGLAATAWIGPAAALAFGFVGAVLWVGVGQLLSWLVDRAALDTARLTDLQRSSSEWIAAQEGAGRLRRTQVQRALALAGPVLARVVETGGLLDEDERVRARIAEGALRDELRGGLLLDDRIRGELAAARERGATVSVLDESAMADLDADAQERVRADLARALAGARSERIFVRATAHDDVLVTVVGRSTGPDGEESVDLWSEVSRHPSP